MAKGPYILVQTGHDTWDILIPSYNFGQEVDASGRDLEDRRYEKAVSVSRPLREALALLHQLERGGRVTTEDEGSE